MENLLTVGLTVYNGAEFLEDCIRSVLNQSYKNFNFIIIDDGSIDESANIVRSFDDPRIRFMSDGQNLNLPARLNQIASMCETKYLARMDSDDIMHPCRLEKQLTILEANPDIDLLGSNAYTIDRTSVIIGARATPDISGKINKVNTFVHPSITGKTQWFKANPYNGNALRIEDHELWYRTRNHSVFKGTNEPLLFYREFGGSYHKKYQGSAKTCFRIGYKHLSQNNIKESVKWISKASTYMAKTVCYRAFNLFGAEDLLIRNRSVTLNEVEKGYAITILQQIIEINEP